MLKQIKVHKTVLSGSLRIYSDTFQSCHTQSPSADGIQFFRFFEQYKGFLSLFFLQGFKIRNTFLWKLGQFYHLLEIMWYDQKIQNSYSI